MVLGLVGLNLLFLSIPLSFSLSHSLCLIITFTITPFVSHILSFLDFCDSGFISPRKSQAFLGWIAGNSRGGRVHSISVLPMPDTRQALKNAVPNQSDGTVEEAFWRLTINENQDGGGVTQSNLYPDRPGEPDCIYYLRTGLCGYGSNCRFNHPKYASQ
ncbi:uncharacterized protein LOC133737924 [Rosa rugosa]|uniref:uncharacterized protein LOC133737924 n=1 Tax=Rosa rugosa TaxID=74645 RepID=UPI002B40EE17|nr:uncharacterized protein LOC133737924 [Rosa rugosa]